MNDSIIAFMLPVNLDHAKTEIVKATIRHFNGDKRAAANALGISLKTIYNIVPVKKSK